MDNKNFRGKLGEDFVFDYLRSRDIKVLERNYHTRLGEIDIIAEEGDRLHFIEVKTRLSDSLAEPFEFVDVRKQRKIILASLEYVQSLNTEKEISYDVYEVICRKNEHFKVETLKIHRDAFCVNEENSKGLNL